MLLLFFVSLYGYYLLVIRLRRGHVVRGITVVGVGLEGVHRLRELEGQSGHVHRRVRGPKASASEVREHGA